MAQTRIALIGDFNPAVTAHRAINQCFALARTSNPNSVEPQWLGTEQIVPGIETMLEAFGGIWCVPASPYRNTEGALTAIEFARTRGVPFLGTCGGCQHALLEYASNVLGLKDCGHAELDPATPMPLLDRMHCPLIEQSQPIVVTDEGFCTLYGAASGVEGYHCSYGLNPKYEKLFSGSSLENVARSEAGEARAFQVKDHPFFIGTLFQPERRALIGALHPLVAAFFGAVQPSA